MLSKTFREKIYIVWRYNEELSTKEEDSIKMRSKKGGLFVS